MTTPAIHLIHTHPPVVSVIMNTASMDTSSARSHGMRYKRHVVYCRKLPGETSNSSMQRAWFVMKNISRMSYEQLEMWSKYYVNVYHKAMQYDADVHGVLEATDHITMSSSRDRA